ncbi:hypothetical protein CAP47_07120 [Psychroflexus sp. S27]|uniref:DUF4339 domain-containing protein n=1 Tax=Psychroflexus sp. S27 TaxID=1982757 RepID=UPI000C2AA58A|nr:DUF4339 domain-containing protein [Psychroflexus sp. S27]PJX22790.1 hypothetical protein CAP47_07120 [Psychroflexus sp. S27]
MKKYYYSDGEEKFGPLNLKELCDKDLKPDSLIWYKGLEKWRLAINIEELNFKFDNQSQREVKNKDNPQTSENDSARIIKDIQIKKKLNHLLLFYLYGLIALFILVALFYNTTFEYYFSIVSDLYNKQGLISDYDSFKKQKGGFSFIVVLTPIIITGGLYFYHRKQIKNH